MENMQIPKLNNKNYTSWKFRILSILEGKDLHSYIVQDIPEDDELKVQFKIKDAQAKAILTCAMDDTQVSLILTCKTSKEIWNSLKIRYESDTIKRRIESRNDVSRLIMKGDETWQDYLLRAEKLLENARTLGAEIEDQEFVISLMRGLPPKFHLIAMQFDNNPNVTMTNIRRSFQNYQERLGIQDEEISNAFKVFSHKSKPGYKNTEQKYKNFNNKRCNICKKFNHNESRCWFNPINQNKYQASNTKEQSFNKSNNANFTKQKVKFMEESQNESAFSVQTEKDRNKNKLEWIIDSGATSHMTPNIELIKNIKEEQRQISLADETYISSEGIGEIQLKNGKDQKLIMKDVLYVPKLKGNLISVSKLTEQNFELTFNKREGFIKNENGELLITAKKQKNFYIVKTEDSNQDIVYKVKENSKLYWHKRLGHTNERYMDMMLKHQMVDKLNYDSREILEPCVTCIKAKCVRKPFYEIKYKQSNVQLELLHIDLIGPIETESIGGSKYILTIVDDYSRKIFTEFLKTKYDAKDKLIEFIKMIENNKGKKVKKIRSDNGTEFCNDKLKKFFHEKGIDHQLTTPYTPKSNGLAERANRTILDGARAILIDSKLPIKFWAEAVATTTYLKNHSLVKPNEKLTPEEKFTGRKPSVKHLRIFGCECHYWIPKIGRTKFSPRTKIGTFIGYSRIRKAYRIYDIEKNRIIESRDVIFIENKNGIESMNVNTTSTDYSQLDIDYLIPKKGVQQEINDELQQAPHTSQHEEIEIEENEQLNRNPENQIRIQPSRTCKIRNVDYYESPISTDHSNEENTDSDYDLNDKLMMTKLEEKLPSSYEEAINGSEAFYWMDAMKREINSLQEHKVWELVENQIGNKPIKCKWYKPIKCKYKKIQF